MEELKHTTLYFKYYTISKQNFTKLYKIMKLLEMYIALCELWLYFFITAQIAQVSPIQWIALAGQLGQSEQQWKSELRNTHLQVTVTIPY